MKEATASLEKPHLEIDCQAYIETFIHQGNSLVGVAFKDVEVTYPIMSEERSCHAPMKPRRIFNIHARSNLQFHTHFHISPKK